MPSSSPPARPAGLAAAWLLPALLAVLGSQEARAGLEASCAWPPPGGTAVLPDSTDVMMSPAIGDLDGDGLPEIVFLSFVDVFDINRGQDGVLRVISGADCSEVLSVPDPGPVRCFGDVADRSLEERGEAGVFCPGCGVALADLDDDGDLEIVLLAEGPPRPDDAEEDDFSEGFPRRIVVLDHEGRFVSCGEASPEWLGQAAAPAIADLDADGSPEIVARGAAWNLDGSLRWARPPHGLGTSVIADLDGDGRQEVVVGQAAYREDGTPLWIREDLGAGLPAVADVNGDCLPEIVLTAHQRAELMILDALDGTVLAAAPLPGGLEVCPLPRPGQGGAPSLADVDGDLRPEIGVAGCRSYSVFGVELDALGEVSGLVMLWSAPTIDDSSRITSSTFFDLEGDGSIEALYQDHERLWIFDGLTGAVLDTFEQSNATLIEYPAVADVDADGQAEIVIVANDYILSPDFGLKVLHDPDRPWSPTRGIFNQHSYHQTNIEDDGRIPVTEPPSWRQGNDYRAQLVPSAPQREDCDPAAEPTCDPGGPYSADCSLDPSCPGGVELHLEAAPDPLASSYTWTIDCDGDIQILEGRAVLVCVPVSCQGCDIALDVGGEDLPSAHCESFIEWSFSEPPLDLDAGPDAEADCASDTSPLPPMLVAACGASPVPTHERERIDGPCPGRYTLVDRWTATDACGELVSDERVIEVVDETPPALDPAPEDLVLSCDEEAPLPVLGAVDDCSGVEVDFDELRIDGPCASSYRLVRTWTATDACGNVATEQQDVVVEDRQAPSIGGVPPDLTVSCGEVPDPASPSVSDDCDPEPSLDLVEELVPGPCADSYRLLRTWTATDACGNVATEQQEVVVEDRQAPSIGGVPPDLTVPCGEVPEPASPSVSDDCDPEPSLEFAEELVPGPCPHSYDILRTWTATDRCGNISEQSQLIAVRDLEPPLLVVPEPLVLECESGGGFDLDDERIQAWLASASASDDCTEPVAVSWEAPDFFPVGCPDPAPQIVSFTAVDECGNEASGSSTISVVDRTPPLIVHVDLPGCLWSPNHMYACFMDLSDRVVAVDSCGGEVEVRVEGCSSDQPDEAPEEGDGGGREQGNGDGHHFDDCVVAPDGSGFCVRFERQGTDPEGRHYGISLVATDACGNASVLPWELFVPHDQREHPCPNTKRWERIGPNEPFPWER